MHAFPFRSTVFRTAVVCTTVLFAIAASIPNDAIAFVAWLIAVVAGVPASLLSRGHAASAAAPAVRLGAARRVVPRLLGALSALVGIWALAWQAYSHFIRLPPASNALTAIAQALLAMGLIAGAYPLLWESVVPGVSDHGAA